MAFRRTHDAWIERRRTARRPPGAKVRGTATQRSTAYCVTVSVTVDIRVRETLSTIMPERRTDRQWPLTLT